MVFSPLTPLGMIQWGILDSSSSGHDYNGSSSESSSGRGNGGRGEGDSLEHSIRESERMLNSEELDNARKFYLAILQDHDNISRARSLEEAVRLRPDLSLIIESLKKEIKAEGRNSDFLLTGISNREKLTAVNEMGFMLNYARRIGGEAGIIAVSDLIIDFVHFYRSSHNGYNTDTIDMDLFRNIQIISKSIYDFSLVHPAKISEAVTSIRNFMRQPGLYYNREVHYNSLGSLLQFVESLKHVSRVLKPEEIGIYFDLIAKYSSLAAKPHDTIFGIFQNISYLDRELMLNVMSVLNKVQPENAVRLYNSKMHSPRDSKEILEFCREVENGSYVR